MSPEDFEALKTELDRIEEVITLKYENCMVYENNNIRCVLSNNDIIGKINKPAFHVNEYSLIESIEEIKKDIVFTLERRGPRMKKNNPNPGKIAGVIAYRLSKGNIVNMAKGCASCQHQCPQKLNFKFAVKCAFEYMDIEYLRIKPELRRELLYSIAFRHTNQETLALVLDTMDEYVPKKATKYK